MTNSKVSAAVLAGGESRRFGTDKALVPLPGETTPMLGVVVSTLLAVTTDVTIIAPESRAYSRFGVPVVSEANPGQGPLGGLEMALQRAAQERCFVVACDQPYLSVDLVRWMIHLDCSEDALVPLVSAAVEPNDLSVAARPQPLHSIYRRSCLGPIRSLLATGERRLGRLLELIDVRYIDEEAVRQIDPGLRSFVNLNSITEWEAAGR